MSEQELLRVPPSALEAEQSILGSMMLDNSLITNVMSIVSAEDFYSFANGKVFDCIANMYKSDLPVDVVTVWEKLIESGLDGDSYSLPQIGNLAKNTPLSRNIDSYAKIVKEKSNLRKLIDLCNEVIQLSYSPGSVKSDAIISEADAGLSSIIQESTALGSKHISDYIASATDELEYRVNNKTGMVGVATGFKGVDERLLGLEDGELYVIAARPAMGKTALAVNMAQHASTHGGKALFISLEMPVAQLISRIWASYGVDHNGIRSGKINPLDWPKITTATAAMIQSGLYVDETSSLSISRITAIAKKRIKQSGKMPIFIDYLQIMGTDGNSRGRYEDVTNFSMGLKGLAKTLGVPIVVLSQLSRSLESRPNKRPVMSDLKESGAIEQDAGAIMFIYRDEVYNPETDFKGMAEIIFGKNRHGECGTVPLIWEGMYQKFSNMNFQQMQDFNHKSQPTSTSNSIAKRGKLK